MMIYSGQSPESVASAPTTPSARPLGRAPKAAKASRSAQSLPPGTPGKKRKLSASRSEEPASPHKKARSTPPPLVEPNETITEESKAGAVDDGKGGQASMQIPEPDDVPFTIECPAKVYKKTNPDDNVFRKKDDGGLPALKIEYGIRPGKMWKDMKNFSRVRVHEWELKRGDFCYLAKTAVMDPRPDDDDDDLSAADPLAYERENLYLCMMLEAKAADARHVYLRVVYLYWPEELPQGRLPYHGMKEVVLSNHMDIVDAHTIHSKIDVQHVENDNDENLGGLYWRQTLDISHKARGMKEAGVLSKLELYCRCQQPSNPDKPMFICKGRGGKCGLWGHEHCLIEDILDRAWGKFEQGTLREEVTEDVGNKVEQDNIIEVKPQKDRSPLRKAIAAGFEGVKTAFGVGAASAMPTPESESDKDEKPAAQVNGQRDPKPKMPKSVRKGMIKQRKTGETAPWLGKLSATIDATGRWGKEGVLMAQVVDLRAKNGEEEGEGEVVWTTPVRCPACEEKLG